MPKLRVHCFGLSLDGYGAGPRQSLEDPMGVGGMALHAWVFPTRTFQRLHRGMGFGADPSGGTTGVDDAFAARGFEGIGAWIMGRHMFGPGRGAWDLSWRGWWGERPPFGRPVFVLTHHARGPLEMEGGTTFHFVTGGVRAAYERAMEAAGGLDVRLGGGVSAVRQYLRAGLVDEMHLAVGPVALGAGEHLFEGLDLPAMGLRIAEHACTPGVMHVVFRREG